MPRIDCPNHTQIPNSILGDILKGNVEVPGLMAELEGSQLKVLLAVCRLTFGFHQNQRRASLTTIQKLTGLSRPAVIAAANRLEELNLIVRFRDCGVTLWQIVVNSINQEDEGEVVNSVNQSVNSVNHNSKISLPPSKKETKKKPKKETERASPKKQEIGPLNRAVIDLCVIDPAMLINGLKLDYQNLIRVLVSKNTEPETIKKFGVWWGDGDPPTLKQVSENWALFEQGKPRRFTSYKQEGRKNGKSSTGIAGLRTKGRDNPIKKCFDPATGETYWVNNATGERVSAPA